MKYFTHNGSTISIPEGAELGAQVQDGVSFYKSTDDFIMVWCNALNKWYETLWNSLNDVKNEFAVVWQDTSNQKYMEVDCHDTIVKVPSDAQLVVLLLEEVCSYRKKDNIIELFGGSTVGWYPTSFKNFDVVKEAAEQEILWEK